MVRPGDVVTVLFPGAISTKRRPVVVVSTSVYHAHRPDVIVGLLTSNIAVANTPTDYLLHDWSAANLRAPSAFRCYLLTFEAAELHPVGTLTERDWLSVQNCLSKGIAVPDNMTS